jgi:hypothetical protein
MQIILDWHCRALLKLVVHVGVGPPVDDRQRNTRQHPQSYDLLAPRVVSTHRIHSRAVLQRMSLQIQRHVFPGNALFGSTQ